MSGVFDPNEPGIFATDDEDVAKAHGLNYFDEESGQWVKRDATEHGDNADPAREDASERELRDETPEKHDALAQGLAPGEQPAAEESGTAGPLVTNDEGAETGENETEDDEQHVDEPVL